MSRFGPTDPFYRALDRMEHDERVRRLLERCDHWPEPFSPVCGCTGHGEHRCPCRDVCETYWVP